MSVPSRRFATPIGFDTRALLCALGTAAVAALIALSLVDIPRSHAQSHVADWQTTTGGKMSFDVASVKQHAALPVQPQRIFLWVPAIHILHRRTFLGDKCPDYSVHRFCIQAHARSNSVAPVPTAEVGRNGSFRYSSAWACRCHKGPNAPDGAGSTRESLPAGRSY